MGWIAFYDNYNFVRPSMIMNAAVLWSEYKEITRKTRILANRWAHLTQANSGQIRDIGPNLLRDFGEDLKCKPYKPDAGRCAYCWEKPKKVFRCRICKTTYCGSDCQLLDWAHHKLSCRRASATQK